MIVRDHKIEYLDKKTQVVLLDDQGKSIDSCNTLFPISIFGEDTIDNLPFLESLWSTIVNFEVDQPLEFPCIRLDIDKEEKYFDTTITKKMEGTDIVIVWILIDFTDHYRSLISLQQQRNESEIKGEFHELEQKNIRLEKQLLELKNNELERIQNFKETFYANLSHEIRTPVNGIVGLVELLKSNPKKEKVKDYLHSLEATGHHLVSIVSDVLDLSKIEAGKLSLKEEEFPLKETIKVVFDSFQSLCDQKSLRLVCNYDEKIPAIVFGDRTKLTQVLYNIIGNATKFTQKGQITLSIECQNLSSSGTTIRILIKDTGAGIPENNLESIFDPFEQLENNTSIKGTGLGLSIVKKLVVLMGGEINVSSEVNVGSTFIVELPLSLALRTSQNTPSKQKDAAAIKKRNILIVDDDPTSLLVLKDFLISHGANVSTTSNPTDVVNILARELFDVVIMDYNMPQMTVEALLKDIKQEIMNMNRFVTIMVLTGDISPNTMEKLMNDGVAKVLHKPFVPEELLESIDECNRVFMNYTHEELTNLDLRYLRKIMQGDEKRVKRMMSVFCESMPENIEQTINYFAKSDNRKLAEVAHKAKSGCAYLGMHKIQRILHNLEHDALNNYTVESYQEILPVVQTSMINIIKDLKTKINS